MIRRPSDNDCASYYWTYIGKVAAGDGLAALRDNIGDTLRMLRAVPEDQETSRYAPGKWTVREVVGHVIDAELVFGYRALSFARADPAALPSMDQDQWAADSNAASRPLPELADELEAVRAATVNMFGGFDAAALTRRGTASGNEFTVGSLAWIIAGHEIHHRTALRDLYGLT